MRFTKLVFGMCSVVMLVIIMFGTGCSNSIKKGMAPDWYLNPPASDTIIYGTGASEKTQSLELGKQIADANARTNLANSIQVSIQSMLRTYLQQSGTMETARALQFAESVSKQVVDIKLTGVTISTREIRDGRWFSLAEVSQETMKNALLSAVRDAAAEYSELKARQAFGDLEKEVNKGNIPIIKE